MIGIFLMNLLLTVDSTVSIGSLPMGNDKSGPGFAVSTGLGALYGGTSGVSLEYQFVLNSKLRLTPLASVGYVTGTDSTGTTSNNVGGCAGINMEFGKMRRFFTGLTFGALLVDEGFDVDSNYVENTVIGPSLIAGIKWTTCWGFLWEISGGMGYQVNNKVDPEMTGRILGIQSVLAPGFNVGIGYKF
jgi:hypothetical protein